MVKRIVFVILTVICVLVSFIYRNKFYWQFPPIADTFDEFASGWLGLSLLKNGIPTSWSFLPIYKSGVPLNSQLKLVGTNISVNGVVPTLGNYSSFPKPISLANELNIQGYKSQFDIVSPYLEQPPLGGIVVSIPLYVAKIKTFSDANLVLLRKPFVILGTISVLLVILIAYFWYGRTVALVAGFGYATVPTVVFGSRLALPENLLTVVFLLEIVFLEYFRRTKDYRFLIPALVLAFLAPLIKPFGLSASLIGAGYFLIVVKNYRWAFNFVLMGVLSIIIYVIYGFGYDKNTFLAAIAYHGTRFSPGPIALLVKILVPRVTKIFLDGWILFGWMALFTLAFLKKNEKHKTLLIASFSYVIGLVLFGGEDFGWYRLPLYPFLLIGSGYLIVRMIRKPDFFTGFLFTVTSMATSLGWGLGIYDWTPYVFYFRIFILIVSGVLILSFFVKNKGVQVLQSGMLLSLFLISLILNTRAINSQQEIWSHLGNKSSVIMGRE